MSDRYMCLNCGRVDFETPGDVANHAGCDGDGARIFQVHADLARIHGDERDAARARVAELEARYHSDVDGSIAARLVAERRVAELEAELEAENGLLRWLAGEIEKMACYGYASAWHASEDLDTLLNQLQAKRAALRGDGDGTGD